MAAQRITKHYQKPWQLFVSVCVTRQNVLTRELSDIEKRYAAMQEKIEFEQSVLCDYEKRKKELEDIVDMTTRTKKFSEKEEEKTTEASRLLANIQVLS